MLQTCLEFVVPLAELPNLRPLESDAGWLPHGCPQDRVWDPGVLCSECHYTFTVSPAHRTIHPLCARRAPLRVDTFRAQLG